MKRTLLLVPIVALALGACDQGSMMLTEAPSSDTGLNKKGPLPAGLVYNQYNGNYYEAVSVPEGISQVDAMAAIAGKVYNQCTAHLAVITSKHENAWIVQTFPNASPGGYWLGGVQAEGAPEPGGGWGWVTGEQWLYTNWAGGEPNDNFDPNDDYNEASLNFLPSIWGGGDGTWNDQKFDDTYDEFAGVETAGYVVEYECGAMATGGGQSSDVDGNITGTVGFNAMKGSDAVARGQIEAVWGETELHTEVTCLSVWGNSAWIGSVTTQSNSPDFPVGTQWFWRVIDNGQGAAADPDQEGYFFYTNPRDYPLAGWCALQKDDDDHPRYAVRFDLKNGNYRVH